MDLVVSGSSNNYNGIYVAAQYEVQTLLDPVMNLSFSECEAYGGIYKRSRLWDTLFAQAASEENLSIFSSGDSGAAGCGTKRSRPSLRTQILSINCYLLEFVCHLRRSGTEFADSSESIAVLVVDEWHSTRSPRCSYIPEGAWNQSVRSSM